MSADGPHGEALARELAALGFSGVVLAEGPDGLLARVALGWADRANRRPNTAATRFGTASVGKLFTAVALVRLFERGLAAPGTALADVLPPEHRPATLHPGVTLEHLLTHTSGIADYVDEAGGEAYEDLWLAWNPAVMRAPADLVPLMRDRPPRAEPGAEVRYNNGAFVLLGLVLEALTGRSFYDVIDDEVFGPAGMGESGYPALDDVVPDLATGYIRPAEDGGPWRTNASMIPVRGQPDGGAYVTAGDLVRFMEALGDGRLLGPAWLDELLRPRVRDEEDEVDYGLGIQLAGEGIRAHVGHPGGDPGFSAYVAWYREAGVRAAMLTNTPPGGYAARLALETLVLPM